MKLFLAVAVIATMGGSVGCIASETKDVYGDTINIDQGAPSVAAVPAAIRSDAATARELSWRFQTALQCDPLWFGGARNEDERTNLINQYAFVAAKIDQNSRALRALNDQLTWMVSEQAVAVKLNCKIGIELMMFQEENKMELEWYVCRPDDNSREHREGVAIPLILGDLDYIDVGDVMQGSCFTGRRSIHEALGGFTNLFVAIRDYFAGNSHGSFVQFRLDGNYIYQVQISEFSIPEDEEVGCVSVENALAEMGWDEEFLTRPI
ncbi:MAG: hypothetical protein LBT03_00075 [Holosporales bacterium]|jgi:hypothetical protein|nr:hypothetical protein [Holosporales bacterium]